MERMTTRVFPKSTRARSRGVSDPLATEEPLEIRLEYWAQGKPLRRSVSITMRTPGHDFELASGFLFTEGMIRAPEDIKHIRHCGPFVPGQGFRNIVRVELHPTVSVNTTTMERNFYTTSSCGICGKTSIEALKVHNPYGENITNLTSLRVSGALLLALPDLMKSRQPLFQRTGGCHASGLFDTQGNLVCLREDVGRHNALDKVLGWALMNGRIPLHEYFVLVSGRASFELMQKASMGGIPLLASVGAPSSLAVQVAKEFNMTLVGFLDGARFNLYHDPGRVQGHWTSTSRGDHGRRRRNNGRPIKAPVGNSSRRSPRPSD